MHAFLLLIALLGHALLWIGLVNRLHALGIRRRIVSLTTVIFFWCAVLIPVGIGQWLVQHSGLDFLYDSAGHDGRAADRRLRDGVLGRRAGNASSHDLPSRFSSPPVDLAFPSAAARGNRPGRGGGVSRGDDASLPGPPAVERNLAADGDGLRARRAAVGAGARRAVDRRICPICTSPGEWARRISARSSASATSFSPT